MRIINKHFKGFNCKRCGSVFDANKNYFYGEEAEIIIVCPICSTGYETYEEILKR
jgi:rubredoxin